MKKNLIYIGLLITSFFGGTTISKGVEDVQTIYVPDPHRTIEVLSQLNITDEDLQKLVPVVQVDQPIIKNVSSDNDIEGYLVDSILDGKQPALGGILSSSEIQQLYLNVAEKKNIINSDNMSDGGINIYDQLRNNPGISTD